MKALEFLPEAISLTKFKSRATQAVRDSILESLYHLSDTIEDPEFTELEDADDDEFDSLFVPLMTDYFQTYLKQRIEHNLTRVSHEMLETPRTRSGWASVKIQDTGSDRGLALPDNTIALSKDYFFDPLVKGMVDNLAEVSADWYNGSRFQGVKDLLKYLPKDKRLQALLTDDYYHFDSQKMREMIGTFIHEVVHIAQHIPQQKSNRSTEYRSYLEKSPEKFRAAFDKKDGEYVNPSLMYRMHAGSPQEIAALSHDLALEIIDELGWDEYDDPSYLERVDYQHLLGKVKDHLSNRGIVPKTPEEIKVFKRYIKLVFTEVERYREWRLKQLKQHDNID